MQIPVFLLLVILASLLGSAVSQQNKTKGKTREKWCRLNLGPAYGGRCGR
ncbi:ductus ejaculatorius peptide 99B [Drosophila teissieri]|nr:ductus ejaculatorius peptide 99B [Drosophila teissieri]